MLKNKNKKRTKKITDDEILLRLKRWIPKIVNNTVKRYEKGPLAEIFNEADMLALAEDTSLEVLRRVKIGLKNRKLKDSVDLRGCESYFKTAFKNQCLKIYEKYAKTDIRAGIQTIGSEEAMAVASSKNLYSPEDTYLVSDQIDLIMKSLKNSDNAFNIMVSKNSCSLNKPLLLSDLQYYHKIFKGLLDGYTAEEIEKNLCLDNSTFLRQKRLLFEKIKNEFPNALEDMKEHFETKEDYRVHTRDVNKRQKLKQAIKEYKPKFLFYVHTSIDEKDYFTASLYARIEMYDRFGNSSRQVAPKLLKIKEIKGQNNPKTMINQVKDTLWKESKSEEIKTIAEKEANSYLEELKNKEAS